MRYESKTKAALIKELKLLQRKVHTLEKGNHKPKKRSERTVKTEMTGQWFFDKMLEGCMIIGRDWKYLYVNKTAAKHGLQKRENLIGRTMQEIYLGVEKSEIFAKYKRCMVDRVPQHFEEKFSFESGVTNWYFISVQPIPEGIFVLSLDITKRKLAEEELKRTEQSLSEAQRLAHLGNWELDLKNNILTWSDEIYRIFEIDPKKFGASYEAFLEAIHPDDREFVNNAYTYSVTNKSPYSIDHRLLFPDGRIKFVHEECETFYDKQGNPLRSMGTVQDITERKSYEQALLTASQYARGLIEASLDPLVTISQEGVITDVNHATEFVTGFLREQLIGKDFSDFFVEPKKAREGYETVLKKGIVRDYPLQIKHVTGKITYVLYNAVVYKNQKGEPQGIFAAARDITVQKKAEVSLQERERYSQSLLRLSKKFELAQTYSETLNAAREEVKSSLGYQSLWVYLISEDKKYFKALMAGGPMSDTVLSEEGTATLTIQGDRMLEEIAEAKEIIIVEDARKDPRTNKEIVKRLGNRTIVNIPVYLFDKHFGSVGTGTFGDEGVRVPTKPEQEYLLAMASHLAVALDRIHLLNERKRAEEALRVSEEKFLKAFRLSPVALTLAGIDDGILVEANDAFEKLTGYKVSEVLGKTSRDFQLFPVPGERERFIEILRKTGQVRNAELYLTHKSGALRIVQCYAETITIGGKQYILTTLEDITERKHAEDSLIASRDRIAADLDAMTQLQAIGALFISKGNLREVLEKILDTTISITGADMGNIQLLDQQSGDLKITAHRGFKKDWLEFWDSVSKGHGTCGTALERRERVIVEDVTENQIFIGTPALEVQLKAGIRAVQSTPLMSRTGKPLGMLSTHYKKAGRPDERSLKMIDLLARQTADILDAANAEDILIKRENDLKEAQRIGKFGNWDWNVTTDAITWSEEYYKIYELDPKQKPPGYEEHLKVYTPNSATKLDAAVKHSMQTGEPYELDLEFVTGNGKRKWVTARCECKFDSTGKIVGLRGTAQDVTDHKMYEQAIARLNRVYKVLSETNQLIVRENDKKLLMKELCRIAVEDGKLLMAAVSFVDNETNKVIPFAWYGKEEGYLSSITISVDDSAAGKGPTGRAIKENRYVFSTDIASEPTMQPWREQALKRGYHSSASFPLVLNKKVMGAFTVYAGEPNFFNEHELSLLNELAMDISYALQNLEIEESRKLALDALLESEEKFRQLASSAQDSIVMMDEKGKFFYSNKSFEKLFGYTSEEIEGKEVHSTIVPPRYYPDYVKGIARYKETGEGCAIGKTTEFYAVKKDGKEFPVELSVSTFMFKGKRMALGILRDITERKRAQEEMLRINEWLETIFSNTHMMFAYMDSKFNFIRVNRSYAEADGHLPEFYPGKNHFDLFPYEENLRIFQKVVDTGEPVTFFSKPFEYAEHPERGVSYWDWTLQPIKDANGKVVNLLLSLLNVTERVLAIQELHTSNEQLKQVFDNIEAVVFSLDIAHGKLLKISKACEKVYGLKQEKFFENPRIWMTLIHQEDLPAVQANWQSLMTHEKSSSEIEYRIIRQDGEVRWIRNETKSIADENGKTIRMDGISYDITERRNAEKEIRKLSEAVEQIPVSVVIADVNANIEYVNKAFEDISGYKLEEVIHRNPKIVQSGLTPKETYKDFWETITSGRTWRGEFLNKRKNGELFWENEIVTPLLDKNKRIINYLAIKQDVTEKKMMTEELIAAKNRAEKSNKLKTEFLQQMSHEIRSPMNVTISLSNLIKEEISERVSPEILEYFEGIDLAGKRLIRTVDLILNTSEMYVGTYEPTFTEIDLFEDILQRLKVEFGNFAAKKGLEFSLSNNVAKPFVNCDRYSVTQVFGNLLDNAIKYTQHGKVEITVNKNLNNNIYVTVADTGIGISDDFMKRLFEPFTQEERGYSRRYEGNGLGLALVKKYCDLNSATINVESEKGKGSKFTITFLNSSNE